MMPMAKTDQTPTNFDRLAGHLKDGALSARFVAAYVAAAVGGQDAALQAVIKKRINEISKTYEPASDKAD
jgi:hypothetical protein